MSYGQDTAELLRKNADLRQKLAEAQEDTARLSYIIEESNKGNGWLGDDFWDRVAELCPVDWDEANETQKWGRAAIDDARKS